MRRFIYRMTLSVTILILTLANGMPLSTADDNDPYGERPVTAALRSPGMSLSLTEKDINRLGDRAAVGLTRVLNAGSLTPSQVKSVLEILHTAFAAPRIVAREADREPKAALFLLDCLRRMPASQGLEGEIENTRQFVSAATRK